MKRLFRVFAPLALLAIVFVGARPQQQPRRAGVAVWEPPSDRNYRSTREIERLQIAPDGALLAQTSGGNWRLKNGKWSESRAPLPAVAAASWRGQNVTFDFDGLHLGAQTVPMPASSGTHISAISARGDVLLAAVFGDGLWQWNGKIWARAEWNLPARAREITALAQSSDGTIWLGTRREGLWSLRNKTWTQHLQTGEPFAHNVQNLCSFRGALWASTLEDGLVVRDASGWKHIGKSELSSNAPRQLAVFADKLYVRHSNETVDCFDGATWKRNVFDQLPRKQIISLAADDRNLYLGQWGGWSAWDGAKFSHYLKLPALQIVPLVQIVPDPKTGNLWLATENRGLFEWDARAQKLRHFDERDGLPDDWITGVSRRGERVYAGTFQGGVAWKDDSEIRWHASGWKANISALASDADQTYIATRTGLYCDDTTGVLRKCDGRLAPDQREIQALLPAANGLWIGTRGGLLFRVCASD